MIGEAVETSGAQALLPPTQLETPVPSQEDRQPKFEETQPGLPAFGPSAALKGAARFRPTPYAAGLPAKEEEQIFTGKDLGLEGASASEFDSKAVENSRGQHGGASQP